MRCGHSGTSLLCRLSDDLAKSSFRTLHTVQRKVIFLLYKHSARQALGQVVSTSSVICPTANYQSDYNIVCAIVAAYILFRHVEHGFSEMLCSSVAATASAEGAPIASPATDA